MPNAGGGDQTKVDSAAKDTSGDKASASGKIFIGGLSWETSTEKLTNHFKKYGEIIDSVIMKDRVTGHPRGFGFVTYSDPSVCDRVIKDNHVLDGRTVEIKRSVPRDSMVKGPKTKKIFVGGISPSLSEEEFKSYFSKYGKVVEHQIMQDHSTGRSRGFGFITFDSEHVVDEILSQGKMIELGGKQVEIKKAEPKKDTPEPAAAYGLPSGRGGSGPSANGYGGYGDYVSYYGGANSGPYRSGGSGYGARAGGGYGGGEYGGFGQSGYGSSGYGGGASGGYGVTPLGGGYDGVGGGYYGGTMGGYGDLDGYGSMSYGGYGSNSYGGGYSGGYGSGRYGSGGSGRYHPYGRN